MSIKWAMGGIMACPGLDLLTREYLIIASCVTLGHAMTQLAHVEAALKLGATTQQIVEVILQTMFYASGAAVANALSASEIFDSRLEQKHSL
jgi:4-carboxymuconolactone decarboxylase